MESWILSISHLQNVLIFLITLNFGWKSMLLNGAGFTWTFPVISELGKFKVPNCKTEGPGWHLEDLSILNSDGNLYTKSPLQGLSVGAHSSKGWFKLIRIASTYLGTPRTLLLPERPVVCLKRRNSENFNEKLGTKWVELISHLNKARSRQV